MSGTTHTLSSPSTAKTRVLEVDVNALLADEFIELIIESKVLTGGTIRRVYDETFSGGRTDPIIPSTPHAQTYGGVFKIKITSAANRDIPWKVVTLD